MGALYGPLGGLDEDPYIPPAVVHGRQRRALQAVGSMDLSPEELRCAVILAENITPAGGVDLAAMPADVRALWKRRLAAHGKSSRRHL